MIDVAGMTDAGIAAALAWTPGIPEIIALLVVVLLLFGGRKLPELARSLGRGLRGFKEELHGVKKELEERLLSFDSSQPVQIRPIEWK